LSRKGVPNVTAVANVAPSTCPGCGSTKRTAYTNPRFVDYVEQGLTYHDGVGDVAGIRTRLCKCVDCGLKRHDREKVYQRTAATPPEEKK
jgi:hypothetical protein